jgi:hypothetical protein
MPTEPVVVVENRKSLTYLLCEAAELEHGLMCEYLYAAFSLKHGPTDGVSPEQAAMVERWRTTIVRVAVEEMTHWAIVNNLLTAVGSAPYVARPAMPHQAKGYPAGVQLALVPFGERALRHFCYLERPEGSDAEDGDGFDPTGPALPIMGPSDIVPWGQDFHTVSHLYRSIQQGLHRLADRWGEERLFIGPPSAQMTPDSFRWPMLTPITDLASASAAIDAIVEQGEGARGDWTTAHYGRFVTILEELRTERAADPSFEPAYPCVAAGVRPVEGVAPDHVISDELTANISDLFDAGYDLVLQLLVRHFARLGETDDEQQVLAHTAVTLMFGLIKPLGTLLAAAPVGPEHPGLTAGAGFRLYYQKSFLLPHRRAAWLRFAERLEEIGGFAATAVAVARARGDDHAATTLDRVSGLLGGLATGLSDPRPDGRVI